MVPSSIFGHCIGGVGATRANASSPFMTPRSAVHGQLHFSPADERYVAKMRRLQNVDVLILDDFLTIGINQRGQEDLTKIIFDRDGRMPTIIVSQTTAA